MMKRRLFIFSLGLLLIPAGLRAADADASASEKGARTGRRAGAEGRMDPAARVKAMKEKLGLSDEQAEKIKAIFAKNREKLTGLRDLKPEERREKLREAFKGDREEIGAILTPEQKEKWKEQAGERRSKGGETPKRRKGAKADA